MGLNYWAHPRVVDGIFPVANHTAVISANRKRTSVQVYTNFDKFWQVSSRFDKFNKLKLTYINEHTKSGWWDLPCSQPYGSDFGQSQAFFIGESIEIHQNFSHLLLVHFLKVLVPESLIKMENINKYRIF